MAEAAPAPFLTEWASFFVMTGSSAAALTGLMFVVVTLVMGAERMKQTRDGTSVFSTPTVAHFCAAFIVSAVFCAPWHSPVAAAAAALLVGLFGVGYMVRVALRARVFEDYIPDLEDWTWYTIFPLVTHGALLAGAVGLLTQHVEAMFLVAAGVVLLILIGIRNSWDIVTYIALRETEERK